ncbi:MAG: putative toxin-antitoxin system toxin component, PIN family [Candidatus Binatia bacterium]
MIRGVLDTNTIISGIGWSGAPRAVLDAAIDREFVLLTSPDLLAELRRVLSYRRLRILPTARVQEVLALLPLLAHMVEPEERLAIIHQDPPDNRVLECAITGHASHIVTGDEHLLRLKSFRGIPVLTPAAFLRVLKRRE